MKNDENDEQILKNELWALLIALLSDFEHGVEKYFWGVVEHFRKFQLVLK